MKQTFKFIGRILVAAAAAMCVTFVLVWLDASLKTAFVVYVCTAMLIALGIGAFDANEQKKDGTKFKPIRRRNGRQLGQAAIFVGTACIFMGTPKECEDVCDDLWHWGVQAEVGTITGDESIEVL